MSLSFLRMFGLAFALATLSVLPIRQVQAQCAGIVSTPTSAADCAARAIPSQSVTTLDQNHVYVLAELIDIAEQNNPETRIAWERAKQRADQLGIQKSAYYPILAGVATFADQRIIEPFPKPLAPRGYTMIEVPLVEPELTFQYLLFDFGGRGARVDAATAQKLVSGARFIQINQDVAFGVASAYYKLITAQESLQAAQETLKTAQTTQDAAEDQLANGRSTIPDVLNARAETAQAVFDREAADGDEKIARVTLTEQLGVEPSPNINVDSQKNDPLPGALTMTVEELIDRALSGRPDLMAQVQEIRSADAEIREAKAAYRPKITLSGSGGQQAIWPTVDYGELGPANQTVWSAALGVEWRLFDGGARKNQLALAESQKRAAQNELVEKHDQATRQVWTAYIAFRTAQRQEQAARALLDSANSSYGASLEAYKYGVKNLIDVVTAEKQLAQARLSSVSARSKLLLQAVNLEYVTGNLLRSLPSATKPEPKDNQQSDDPQKQ